MIGFGGYKGYSRKKKYKRFRMVTRSLDLIKIQSAYCHFITRDRLAFFIRFCLHRTVFLVVRTKTTVPIEDETMMI